MSDAELIWKSALLGVVEGLTEFLPVSSTGHIIVAGYLVDFNQGAEFDIFIQIGAMLALTWCYRARLIGMAVEAPKKPEVLALIFKVGLAFVPAAVLGLLTHDWIEENLFSPGLVACTLVIGGVIIIAIDRPERSGGLAELEQISWMQSLAIGFGQAVALIPGMSRSGSTIIAGLLAGLDRRVATDFSFLLALPTLYAACLYSLWNARDRLAGDLGVAMAVGVVTAFISAMVVINAFLRYVQTNTLRSFGVYRIIIGIVIAGLVWSYS